MEFWKKIEEIRKIWAMSGVLSHDVGTPRRSEGPCHYVACPRRGVAEWEAGQALGMQRLSYYSHMEIFVFCFFLLFRCFEDLSIRLMRAL